MKFLYGVDARQLSVFMTYLYFSIPKLIQVIWFDVVGIDSL